jgi:hypothetical protein
MGNSKNNQSDSGQQTDDAEKSPAQALTAKKPNEIAIPAPCAVFPLNLPSKLNLVRGQDGKAYALCDDAKHVYALPIGSRELDRRIRNMALEEGKVLRKRDLRDIHGFLQAQAEMEGNEVAVYHRVAPIENGVEIDLGTEDHSRVRITPGKVEVI